MRIPFALVVSSIASLLPFQGAAGQGAPSGDTDAWTLYRVKGDPSPVEIRIRGESLDGEILRPNTTYQIFTVFPFEGILLGYDILTGPAGSSTFETTFQSWEPEFDGDETYTLSIFDGSEDEDGDLIPSDTEHIIGTNPLLADSDGDGIPDNAELEQGTNPIDGLASQAGVVAAAPVTGSAVDICALNNIVITANGLGGISIFNVLGGLNPVRIAEIDTPGSAVAVACSESFVAVADSIGGLAIIDISNPAEAEVTQTHQLGNVTSVATRGSLVYAGTSTGNIVVIDLRTGQINGQVNLGGGILHLGMDGELLLAQIAVGNRTFVTLDADPFAPEELGRINNPYSNQFFAAGGFAFCPYRNSGTAAGYTVIDYTEPTTPTRVGDSGLISTGPLDVALNGSGLLVAPASSPSGVGLWNVSDPANTSGFLTVIPADSGANAISIYNGLAYIAGGASGLQVVNYLAFDTAGNPPAISLSANKDLDSPIEEGTFLRLSAAVSDDVQVRNVEFHIDGELALTDGNYPFNHVLLTPAITEDRSSFTIRARAVDTGGNATWTDEITLDLVPDATPPEVIAFSPEAGSILGTRSTASVRFNEAVAIETLTAGGLELAEAGPDGISGTGDDVALPILIDFSIETNTAYLEANEDLPPGLYSVIVGPPTADIAGNVMTSPSTAQFRIYSFDDSDGDGVPDDWEAALGLDPTKEDSNGNGVLDGLEDFDGDGLPNVGEIILNRDPRTRDSDGNGIDDGDEDLDLDGLSDGEEIRRGTDPNNPDSDGDGLDDATEVAEGTDPNSPTTLPDSVNSLAATYFNTALPFDIDPGAEIVDGASSQPVSYFNTALPFDTDPMASTVDGASSQPVSYFNTALSFDTDPNANTIDGASSLPVSYFNTSIPFAPFTLELLESYSGIVTYENLEP